MLFETIRTSEQVRCVYMDVVRKMNQREQVS